MTDRPMDEEEEREAIALLREIDAMLAELGEDLRKVQRSMTMIELRMGMLHAVLQARWGKRHATQDEAPDP